MKLIAGGSFVTHCNSSSKTFVNLSITWHLHIVLATSNYLLRSFFTTELLF